MAPKPVKPPRAPGYEAPAVQKAFELLGMVADSAEGLGISELSSALGYSKGTIHGIVQALLKAGVLDQGPQRKKLFLGPTIVELAFKSRSYQRTIRQAQPLLDQLRDRVGQTVFLGMLSRKYLRRRELPCRFWPERWERCSWLSSTMKRRSS
jgi:DNA-binding IclR family transcriptional regulator